MKEAKGYLFAVLGAIGFGLHGFLANMAYGYGVRPLALSFFRKLCVVPVFLILALIHNGGRIRIRASVLGKAFILGFLGATLTTVLILYAFQLADSSTVIILNFTYPVFVILLGRLLYGERASNKSILCLFLCLAGIVVICGVEGKTTPLGIALSLASGLVYGIYILYLDKSGIIEEIGLYPFSFWFFFLSALTLLPPVLADMRFQAGIPFRGWLWMIVLSLVGGVLATTFLQAGIAIIGGTKAALLGALEPVTAAVIGVIFLHESLTARKAFGIILVLLATTLVVLPSGKTRETQS